MSDFLTTEVLDAIAVTVDGEGSVVDIGVFPTLDKNLRPQLGRPNKRQSNGVRFTLDVTVLTGTDMLIDIVAEVDGQDIILGTFGAVTAVGGVSIFIDGCPDDVKVVYTENSITTMTFKVHAIAW